MITCYVIAYVDLSFNLFFFFFNDTATTEIYTLSLHDALPIYKPFGRSLRLRSSLCPSLGRSRRGDPSRRTAPRSEEHTSELQSRQYLVCRLLLEKKKKTDKLKNAHRNKTVERYNKMIDIMSIC